MDLLIVFTSILTLFIVGIVGYYCRKKEILGEQTVQNLPRFLLDITFPCMIISSMQIPYSTNKLDDLKAMFLISIGVYIFSLLFALLIPKILRIEKEEDQGVYKFMSVFSNVAFMGYPVLLSIYSSEAIFYASVFNLPFNFLVFTVGIYFMQSKFKKFNFKILINPSLISVFTGFIFFLFSIKIPNMILQPVEMIGNLTTPLAMIFIGASLTNVDIKKIFTEWRLYGISLIRLIIIPMIILLVLRNFVQDPLLLGIPVIICGMPVAANCAIISSQYGCDSDIASQGIFMTTLLSMFTIPFLVFILSILSV
ncbi:AEC family transporter [Alkalibaculum sp. M08DMB]|uniref:AEC family transporter n=1 Tax=Alkalibaculum sporogenes TaxID=2655001 RepID=A0A6A7K7K9_9FIRM|nr:AEC family transporter [Alkalibaculum sporogenes]MPW25386.1 AEC family transporter [Alkalibaculum sporogenes]